MPRVMTIWLPRWPVQRRLVERIGARLIRTGKHLREQATGRPVTEPAERAQAVGAICDGFFATVLPELVRQGIVIAGR